MTESYNFAAVDVRGANRKGDLLLQNITKKENQESSKEEINAVRHSIPADIRTTLLILPLNTVLTLEKCCCLLTSITAQEHGKKVTVESNT